VEATCVQFGSGGNNSTVEVGGKGKEEVTEEFCVIRIGGIDAPLLLAIITVNFGEQSKSLLTLEVIEFSGGAPMKHLMMK
jgi:hypothetical protein